MHALGVDYKCKRAGTATVLLGGRYALHERLTLVLDNHLDTHANGAFHTASEPSQAHS